jgi:MinD-like ATPase involved in chromosome partitioning or flagellar assembly
MITSTRMPATPEAMPSSTAPEQREVIVELLVLRFPEYADAIATNERLAGALAAAESATTLSAQQIVDHISDRELATAQRPIDVLVSRCLTLICDTAGVAEPETSLQPNVQPNLISNIDLAPPSNTATEELTPEFPSESRSVTADQATRPQVARRKRMRRRSPVVMPTGADAENVKGPFEGHRYVTVVGSVGGAGTTTVTVLLGQMLATLRSDNVAAVDAAPDGGALAFRTGTESSHSIAALLSAEPNIRSGNDLGEFIDRLPTRLGVAKTLAGDAAVSADDYRRTLDLLARHFDILITDIGTATSTDAASPALGLADLVVVVTNPTEHGLWTSARALDALEGHGAGPDRVILMVNGVHRRSAVHPGRFLDAFGERCAANMWLPWDQHLSTGSAVSLSHAHRSTIKATVRLSAAVVQSMSPEREIRQTA